MVGANPQLALAKEVSGTKMAEVSWPIRNHRAIVDHDIAKPGVFFSFQFKPTRFHLLLFHLTEMAGKQVFRKWYIIFVQFPLTHHRFLLLVPKTGATNICNFAWFVFLIW